MGCDTKCASCPIEKMEQEIGKCKFKCESGDLESHRGYMALLARVKLFRDKITFLEEKLAQYNGLLMQVTDIGDISRSLRAKAVWQALPETPERGG